MKTLTSLKQLSLALAAGTMFAFGAAVFGQTCNDGNLEGAEVCDFGYNCNVTTASQTDGIQCNPLAGNCNAKCQDSAPAGQPITQTTVLFNALQDTIGCNPDCTMKTGYSCNQLTGTQWNTMACENAADNSMLELYVSLAAAQTGNDCNSGGTNAGTGYTSCSDYHADLYRFVRLNANTTIAQAANDCSNQPNPLPTTTTLVGSGQDFDGNGPATGSTTGTEVYTIR